MKADDSCPPHRRPLIVIGAVLWTLVFAAALFVLKSNRAVTGTNESSTAAPSRNASADRKEQSAQDPTSANHYGPPAPLEEFELTERSGRTISKADLQGHPWVAAFVFTRCMSSCPMISREFNALQKRIRGTDARLVSITVDPEFDTAERLKAYAENFGADPERWLFLTGSKAAVYRLVNRGFNQYAEEMFGKDRRPGYEVAHTNRVVLVNSDCIPVASYLATRDTDMVRLRRILLGEVPFPQPSASVPLPFDPSSDDDAADVGSPADGAATEAPTLKVGAGHIISAPAVVPRWVTTLPTVNAALNAVATLLLCAGFVFIKSGRRTAHRNVMLLAFATSIAFLACYLIYHFGLKHYTGSSSRPFAGTGTVRIVYLSILLTHIVLAATVPVLTSLTIYRAHRMEWARHRSLARFTFPVWLYVSVTGVIIYGMLLPLAGVGLTDQE